MINSKNGALYNVTVDIAKSADGRTLLYATKGKTKRVGNVQVDSIIKKGPGQNSNSNSRLTQNTPTVKENSDSTGSHSIAVQNQWFFFIFTTKKPS